MEMNSLKGIDIPSELREAAANGTLAIFVGAGVSAASGLPDWKGLVKKVLSALNGKIRGADLLAQNIDEELMSPLEVLDRISSERATVYDVVNRELTSHSVRHSGLHELIARVSGKILTTNFDTLMEDSASGLDICVPSSKFTLSKIQKSNRFLFKVHGSVEQIDHCALFSDQYREIYNADEMVVSELKALMRENTFLYVGFSMTDPYYKYIFDRYREVYGEYSKKSYLVTTSDSVPEGVRALRIPSYADLEEVLIALSKEGHFGADADKSNQPGSADSIERAEEISKVVSGVDVPPQVGKWVGRSAEMEALGRDFKSIFVIGMGGQGKSALAAKYMELNKSKYSAVYWRDFKEEGHNFHSKISSIIMSERGHSDESLYVGYSDEQIVDLLFDVIGERRILVVLDNIDKYIDIENFVPSGGIGRLWRKVESQPHKSKFIFTCRPFINHAGVDFFQLALQGLSVEDVGTLIDESGVTSIANSEKSGVAETIYRITKGHPLWVSLIVAQAKRGKNELLSFIAELERRGVRPSTETVLLSQDILSSVWATLNENQQFILRALAESVSSESFTELERIVSPEMNFNRFNKAISVLGNLNLIVFKGNSQYVELHPLVREFVISKYPGGERGRFIALFASYYGRLVVMLKPKLGIKMSLRDFEKWTSKIHLDINAGNRKDAFSGLREVFDAMKGAGFVEELVGVCDQYLDSIDWGSSGGDLKFPKFDNLFRQVLGLFSEYGSSELVVRYTKRYEEIVGINDERFINVLSIRCYDAWVRKQFREAIEFGERAEYIEKKLKSNDEYQALHHLALARRDSGDAAELGRALEVFLGGDDISVIVDPENMERNRGGAYYGNISRCLFLQGDVVGAKMSLAKAFRIIFDGDTGERLVHLGYAALWFYELLRDSSRDDSFYFLVYAINLWSNAAPYMANEVRLSNSGVVSGIECSRLLAVEEWRVERFCVEYVERIFPAKSL